MGRGSQSLLLVSQLLFQACEVMCMGQCGLLVSRERCRGAWCEGVKTWPAAGVAQVLEALWRGLACLGVNGCGGK